MLFGSHLASEVEIFLPLGATFLETRATPAREAGDAEIKWRSRVREFLRSRLEESQHVVPFRLVFEHDFAEKTNGRHTVVKQLVMEFLQ